MDPESYQTPWFLTSVGGSLADGGHARAFETTDCRRGAGDQDQGGRGEKDRDTEDQEEGSPRQDIVETGQVRWVGTWVRYF